MTASQIFLRRPKEYKPETHIKRRLLAFVDLEFSGLDFEQEILEIGCLLVEQPSFKVISEWETKVEPKRIEQADKSSLEIIGYTEEKWKDALPLGEALTEFNRLAKNAVLAGYNVSWDFSFLRRAYFEEKLLPSFHWQVLDVMSMAFEKLYNQEINGYRMTEVAEFFGLTNGKWHDALADARLTYEIFLKLVKYET